MSSNQQQQQMPPEIPVVDSQEPSEESKRLIALFTEMDNKQLDFLDESGKSVIERISTFLAVLFGVTVLSNTFPPKYLGNPTAKWLVIVTLAFYLAAMAAGILVIQPRSYRRYLYNVSALGRELEKITNYKMFWLRAAGVLFVFGTVALAILIISIVWAV